MGHDEVDLMAHDEVDLMALSALDMFSVGIGPSSSHTVGPMRAAGQFTDGLQRDGLLNDVQRVQAELFGSLGATGHGHGSDKAVILGLQGNRPETVDTDTADQQVADTSSAGRLVLPGGRSVAFSRSDDVTMHRRRSLPAHPNGMIFRAYGSGGAVLRESTYYSVGGGFVVDEHAVGVDKIKEDATPVRYPFTTGAQLLEICAREGLTVSDVMLANELSWRTEEQLRAELLHIWAVMQECVHNGCTRSERLLPGGLKVPRRAPKLLAELEANPDDRPESGRWTG